MQTSGKLLHSYHNPLMSFGFLKLAMLKLGLHIVIHMTEDTKTYSNIIII